MDLRRGLNSINLDTVSLLIITLSGDKPLGQIEVSETTLADPYITEYNLNPRLIFSLKHSSIYLYLLILYSHNP